MPTKPVDTSTEVYLGGRPLGIEIGADGLIVTGISKVETANGAEFPMKDSGVRSGDVLTKIAGKSVVKPEDISTIVNKLPSTDVILTFYGTENRLKYVRNLSSIKTAKEDSA